MWKKRGFFEIIIVNIEWGNYAWLWSKKISAGDSERLIGKMVEK
ncbi:hypothetical protein A45J_2051 [hot springs metagenome]|uniref:Uncharacterized protein n=1 Tax=hot springs metagenome TaxID=433727 RepID=A0A5J4L5X0_9ZZZZ